MSKHLAIILVGSPGSGSTSIANDYILKQDWNVKNGYEIIYFVAERDDKFDKRYKVKKTLSYSCEISDQAFEVAFASYFSNISPSHHLMLVDCVTNAFRASVVAGVLERNGYLPVFVFLECTHENSLRRAIGDPTINIRLIRYNEHQPEVRQMVNRMKVKKHTIHTDKLLAEVLENLFEYICRLLDKLD
jgi:hypothetical protein